MMNKFSIKKRLLVYNFFIQCFIIFIFGLSLYKALELSTLDRFQNNLEIVLLDIADDVIEKKYDIKTKGFDEEKEYKFEPLFIRLVTLNNYKVEIIKSQKYPSKLIDNYNKLKKIPANTIIFENRDNYIIGRIKFIINKIEYVLEVATNKNKINTELENIFYILLFIVPIILILSTIAGHFLIYKSFSPIEQTLIELKNINAKELSKRVSQDDSNDEIGYLCKEINSLLKRLEISFEKVSQFTSDASHELKTPLTIIRGEIEIALRKDRDIEDYKKSLQSSLDEILVIQQTVDDLLFFAKIDNEQEIEKKLIYLDEATIESIEELRNFSNSKKIDVVVKIEDAMEIMGHSKLLKIAIKNIIKNAVNFSENNSKIIVKNFLENEKQIITVEDFGIGIKKEDQEKIFEKFYRTDKSRNKNSGGTGLGLSICKKIIDIHNGKIELQSEENKGTIIKFIF